MSLPHGEYCEKAFFDGWCPTHSFQPLTRRERVLHNSVPKPGFFKQLRDYRCLVLLKKAAKVRGDSHLESVQTRSNTDFVQRMRNEVFASTCRSRRTANFHRNPIEKQ